MAMSEPTLVGVDIPDEAPPNNTFRVSVTVKQGGPDPWASDGSCPTKKLDVAGWKLPVELHVDGEEVDSRELCLASGNKRSLTLSTSISDPGNHRVEVKAYAVGGNAYDLKPRRERVNDDVTGQITVEADARDPSKPGPVDSVKKMLDGFADELGATTTTLGAGMLLMVLLLVVV
ncbi:hypothetical protein [Halorussus halophilus]|uniref:hypothetical protein n=1 Tax=Halorussus halophilus TaxID=2650975 RepID=UPI00130144EC|nr:hypothetical protein [Halorussus halophilus]